MVTNSREYMKAWLAKHPHYFRDYMQRKRDSAKIECRCPNCGFVLNGYYDLKPKGKKVKKNYEYSIIGLTIIKPFTKTIELKELKIAVKKKMRLPK